MVFPITHDNFFTPNEKQSVHDKKTKKNEIKVWFISDFQL